jgi:hypothetical protein
LIEDNQTTENCCICGEPLPRRRAQFTQGIAHAHFQGHVDKKFIKEGYERTEVFLHYERTKEKIEIVKIPLPDSLEFLRRDLGDQTWRNPDILYKKDKEIVLGDVIVWDKHAATLRKVYIMHKILEQVLNYSNKRVIIYEPFDWREKTTPTLERELEWYRKKGLPCRNFRDIAYEIQRRAYPIEDVRFEILKLEPTY